MSIITIRIWVWAGGGGVSREAGWSKPERLMFLPVKVTNHVQDRQAEATDLWRVGHSVLFLMCASFGGLCARRLNFAPVFVAR